MVRLLLCTVIVAALVVLAATGVCHLIYCKPVPRETAEYLFCLPSQSQEGVIDCDRRFVAIKE